MCVESRDGRKLELEASGIQISPPREPHGATDGEDLDCFCLVGVSEQGRCPHPILQITGNACCRSVVSCASSPEVPGVLVET